MVNTHGMFLPKKFFVTSGYGMNPESKLNAFDEALADSNVTQCNLVSVSSILPPDAEEIKPVYITPGTITFCVMARMDGAGGDRIGAGIGWAWGEKDGQKYGMVAEYHGHSSKSYIEQKLKDTLARMAKVRSLNILSVNTKVESVEVKEDMYGTVVVILVYMPWSDEEGERAMQVKAIDRNLRPHSNPLIMGLNTPNQPAPTPVPPQAHAQNSTPGNALFGAKK